MNTKANKITGLKVQKRNPKRVNVYLDGEFALGLSRFVAAWLQVGQELTEEKISELLIEDAQETGYQRAVKYISYRLRTTTEIKQHLSKKGIDEDILNTVIHRLEENGLVNDSNFAQMWIENRNEFRPRSHRLLATELRIKGIDSEIIQETLEATTPDEDLAYYAAQKRVRRYKHLDWNEFYKKLGSFLARRGFSYTIIKPVINQVWTEKNHGSY